MVNTSNTPDPKPAMTADKAIAGFITSFVILLGVIGWNTGWFNEGMAAAVSQIIVALLGAVGVTLPVWGIPNKPK